MLPCKLRHRRRKNELGRGSRAAQFLHDGGKHPRFFLGIVTWNCPYALSHRRRRHGSMTVNKILLACYSASPSSLCSLVAVRVVLAKAEGKLPERLSLVPCDSLWRRAFPYTQSPGFLFPTHVPSAIRLLLACNLLSCFSLSLAFSHTVMTTRSTHVHVHISSALHIRTALAVYNLQIHSSSLWIVHRIILRTNGKTARSRRAEVQFEMARKHRISWLCDGLDLRLTEASGNSPVKHNNKGRWCVHPYTCIVSTNVTIYIQARSPKLKLSRLTDCRSRDLVRELLYRCVCYGRIGSGGGCVA